MFTVPNSNSLAKLFTSGVSIGMLSNKVNVVPTICAFENASRLVFK